jgi:hypothetical protein
MDTGSRSGGEIRASAIVPQETALLLDVSPQAQVMN